MCLGCDGVMGYLPIVFAVSLHTVFSSLTRLGRNIVCNVEISWKKVLAYSIDQFLRQVVYGLDAKSMGTLARCVFETGAAQPGTV